MHKPRVIRTLGDIVRLQRGNTYKSALLGLPGPVLLGLATIQRNGGFRSDSLRTYGGESDKRMLLKPGDLYVSLKDVTQAADLLGAVARVPQDVQVGRLTQDTVKLEFVSNEASPSFVYWLLRTPQYRAACKSVATGTTNLGLPREDFLALPICLPNAEQTRICDLLEQIEEKIELNRKMNETLESVARALFKTWFIDFDPVRAKMNGRWKKGQSLPGLPAELWDLFPDSFFDYESRSIPKGWSFGALGQIAQEFRRGITPENISPGTPYIGLEHMPRRSISLSEWGDPDGLESNKLQFRSGEILFGKLRPYFHKVGIAPIDGVCSTDIVVLGPRNPNWGSYILSIVSSEEFVSFTNLNSTGTKMPRTSWGDMARFSCVLPKVEVAAAFDEYFTPILQKLVANIHATRVLTVLRDALLPKLISGEIRISDPQSFLKERGL